MPETQVRMAPVAAREESAREHARIGRWDVWLRSEIGPVRPRHEDAWALLPAAPLGGWRGGCWAVFDGLGGLPYGHEAAWAAARALAAALSESTKPEDVLPRLNPPVRATNGATTAVVAWQTFNPDTSPLQLLGVGDSGAYEIRRDGKVRLLLEKDAQGPYVVTDFLGNPDPAGHVATWAPADGASLLLCSDGVDGVVAPAALADLGRAKDPAAALDALFASIARLGAPDNATAILARRA